MPVAGAMLAIGSLGIRYGLAGRRQIVLSLLLIARLSGGMVSIVNFNRPLDRLTRIDTAPLVWTIQGFEPASR
jgi:hypothetical protein